MTGGMTGAWMAAPASALVVATLLWVNTRLWGFLPDDPPGGRKRHPRPLPMIGVALGILATAVLAAFTTPWIASGAAVCVLVGYFDDRGKESGGGLTLLAKIPCLLVAAALATTAAPSGSLPAGSLFWAVVFAFVVTNAINFLDNSNGVASAVGGIGLLLASGGEGPAAAISFLFLGFLPFNWPVSRAHLGDAGSLCLGYALATTALASGVSSNSTSLAAAVAPVAVPIMDFVQVVCARIWLGFTPWVGDRRHLTHIAMNNGLPHVLVAPVFALMAAGLFFALQ